jgi:hypothetical protein
MQFDTVVILNDDPLTYACFYVGANLHQNVKKCPNFILLT